MVSNNERHAKMKAITSRGVRSAARKFLGILNRNHIESLEDLAKFYGKILCGKNGESIRVDGNTDDESTQASLCYSDNRYGVVLVAVTKTSMYSSEIFVRANSTIQGYFDLIGNDVPVRAKVLRGADVSNIVDELTRLTDPSAYTNGHVNGKPSTNGYPSNGKKK